MAFPFVFESNFELGTVAEWDSETDVELVLNIRHYSFLARKDATTVGPIAPYQGAYCAEWNLSGDTADHVLIEGDMDIADTGTAWVRFALFLGKDLRGTTDIFNIFELQGTADAVEAAVGLRVTTSASQVEIGIGQTAPASFATQKLNRGQWYFVEMAVTDNDASAGTIDLYIDGALVQAVTGLTQTPVLRGVLGVQNTLNTTLGHIFVDSLIFDDLRVYPITSRYPQTILLTKSAHVFMGEGSITNAILLAGAGTDCVMSLFDTDVANILNASNLRGEVANVSTGESVDLPGVPTDFQRGCYVSLTGTNPRALITIGHAQGYFSAGRVRQHGTGRNASAQGVQ